MNDSMAEPLEAKHCVPCEGGTKTLTEGETRAFMTSLDTPWNVVDGNKKISRTFTFKDFSAAMRFAVAVGEIAGEEGHHPDLHVSYGKVTVELWTHAIGGLSENDFILARKIELIERKV
jgi:4a-hydroxytetrahydrobiopterin dehydratase